MNTGFKATDETTGQFSVERTESGKFKVRDTRNGKFLRFSYSAPPTYESSRKKAAEWGNYYCARGFAQKMATRNPSGSAA